MSMKIAGRNALVTGGAHRIGKAVTLKLAEVGANVFIHCNRSIALAEETKALAKSHGVNVAMGSMDLSDPRTGVALIEHATNALGPISILVNNASSFPEDRLQDVSFDQFRATQDLTLSAPVFLTQAFAEALPHNFEGSVVNVTDVKTATPNLKHFSYIVAKGGLNAFTYAAALALAPTIRVNAVALGVILPPSDQGADYAEKLGLQVPMGRSGGTDPVAEAVLSLIENDYITGEIVRIDGGGHLV